MENQKRRIGPKEIINTPIFSILLLSEVFFLCYITLGYIDLILVCLYLLPVLCFIFVIAIFLEAYDEPFRFRRNIKQYHRPIVLNKKNIIIVLTFITEIIVAFFVKVFIINATDPIIDFLRFFSSEINLLIEITEPTIAYDTFVIVVFLVFDLFLMRVVPLARIPLWNWLYQFTFFMTRFIIFYYNYLSIDWVLITMILQVIVLILMIKDLDFRYLQAFVPDVLYLLVFWGTSIFSYVVIIMFCIYLGNYVFE